MELLERTKQIAELEAALRESASARGSLVLVTGEAGVGKTVLVKRFAEQSDARVLWGLCDELVTPRPLGPFRDMFTDLNSQLDLQAFLDAVLDELNGHKDPAVVVVEDAHWADQATLDAIRFLGRRIARMRAMLVVTYRDDEVPGDHPLRRALGVIPPINIRRIRLSPLSEDGVAALAHRSGIDAGKLHELTGGNPFYVGEVLADPESHVPISVQDAVLARVGRLGDLGRRCVEMVSAVPGDAEPWLLDASSVSAGIDDAVRLGVLRRSHNAVTFSHELVRRAVEQSLTEARRQELNGEILDALVARNSDPARLTHHAVRAGRAATIARYAPLAARLATAAGAHLEAFDHYQRALKHGEHYSTEDLSNLLYAAGHAGLLSAQFDDAYAPTARAIELCRANGDQTRLGTSLCLLAEIEWCRGRGREAQGAANEAVALLERVSTSREALVHAYALQARLAMLDHRPDATIVWGDRAAALSGQNGHALPADLLVTVGSARAQRSPDDTTALVDALHAALDEHNVHAASRAYVNLASELTLHMRYEQALPYLDTGLDFLERHDQLVAIDHMRAARAIWHLDQGKWLEAGQEIRHVTSFESPSQIIAQLVIGLIQARRGEPTATATLANAATRAEAAGEAQVLVPTALARAEQAWLTGDRAGVTAALGPIRDIAFRSGLGRWIGEAALWLHRVGDLEKVPAGAAEPYALQISGRWREAAAAWATLGRPYEEADALADASEPKPLLEALTKLNLFAAMPRSMMVRRRLTELGVSVPHGPRASTRANPAGLTLRQIDVLQLLAENLTYQAIAEKLYVSIKTVDRHATAIRSKLGVGNRNDAVEVARRLGIVD